MNLQHRKTPIYLGINDLPIAPTSQAAGNGADLLNRINGLVDDVQSALNALESGKLDASEAENFFRLNDARPLQTGIYSPLVSLTVSTNKTEGNEIYLNLAAANVFRVNIDANMFSDLVFLRTTGNYQRAGQIFVVIFFLDSTGSGTLEISSTDFFGATPPDITVDGEFQAITYLVSNSGFGSGNAFVIEIARGPVLTSGGGY